MAPHEGRALVLDIKDYRETSSLIQVFTENEGRISLVARGLRRPKTSGGTGGLQPFNLVRLNYYLKEGATIGNLGNADLERVSSAPRDSLEAYALISYWFEILRETAQPRQAASDIFELSVHVLDQQEIAPGLSVNYLNNLTRLCQYLGFGLTWTHCVACGCSPGGALQFSLSQGGILCGDCVHQGHAGITLKPGEQDIIAAMAAGGEPNNGTLSLAAMVDLLGLMDRYLAHHLEHAMKTFGFVRNTLTP